MPRQTPASVGGSGPRAASLAATAPCRSYVVELAKPLRYAVISVRRAEHDAPPRPPRTHLRNLSSIGPAEEAMGWPEVPDGSRTQAGVAGDDRPVPRRPAADATSAAPARAANGPTERASTHIHDPHHSQWKSNRPVSGSVRVSARGRNLPGPRARQERSRRLGRFMPA